MPILESEADVALNAVAKRTAFVLETNNLRGGDGAAKVVQSLQRLVSELAKQSLPPALLAQWVITHDGLSAEVCADLQLRAGCAIDFVEISEATGYYDAKNAGFDAVDAQRCDYVIFGDADCRPATRWIEHLLAPFARPAEVDKTAPVAVAGRTSYAPGVFGSALTSIDFMYFPSPLAEGGTRNFYANNVAFKREVFAQYRYEPLAGVYRAHCQVMGLRLQQNGVVVEYAANAHTEHRLPDTHKETVKLRWMRGEDSVGLTPYLAQAYVPKSLQWLFRRGPLGPLCVMLMRLGYSLRALGHQDMPALGPVRYLAAVVCTIGISALDTLGALVRSLGLVRSTAAQRELAALSYHRN